MTPLQMRAMELIQELNVSSNQVSKIQVTN
jgi:spore maturation protein SpmA